MKIDIVIGNPPYQDINGGGNTVAKGDNLYGKFVRVATSISSKLLSFIIPTRWYLGDKGTDEDTRRCLVDDKHLQYLVDFNKSSTAFENVEIAGGVCYFLFNKKYTGNCKVTTKESNKDFEIDFYDTDNLVLRHYITVDILKKIRKITDKFDTYNRIMCQTDVFGLGTDIWKDASEVKTDKYTVPVKTSQGIYYIDNNKVCNGLDIINEYKVITGNKAPDRGGCNNSSSWNVLNRLQLLEPGETCSQTYVVLAHGEKRYCESIKKYIETKFIRFLVLCLLPSTTVSSKVFRYVPLQNFNSNSDIKWSQSVYDINRQLYEKYGLNKDEIEYIENLIKEM